MHLAATGATKTAIAAQFLAEALLALLGGLAGTVAGIAITTVWGRHQHWPTSIPAASLAAAITAAAVVGTLAGLPPATRAARLNPTDALRT